MNNASNERTAAPNFLSGGGEMGARIRAHDWAATPLGRPERWPQSLRTVVRLMLTTNHPVFVFWGPDHICFYNDAYSGSIGPEKHPAMLGALGRTMWDEIWETIGPQIRSVMSGEGATWHENQLIPIIRHGGLAEVYWTYSYSPIDDDAAANGIGGVLVICTETTEAVLVQQRQTFHLALDAALRELVDPYEVMAAASKLLGRHMKVGRCGYAEIDKTGEFAIIERDWTDGTMPSAVETRRLEDFSARFIGDYKAGRAVRVDDALNDPRVDGEVGDMRAHLTVPLVKNQRFAAAFSIRQISPRRWTDRDEAFVREVAERIWQTVEIRRTAAALREGRAMLDFTLESARVGDWDLDLVHDTARRSLRHDECFGYTEPVPEWGFDDFIRHVHPDDRPAIARQFREAVGELKDWHFECRVVWPDESVHWIAAHGSIYRTLQGKPARMLGIISDITERKTAEEALRASEARFQLALDAASAVGTWDWDVKNDLVYADARVAKLYSVDRERAAAGAPIAEFIDGIHPGDRERVGEEIRRAIETANEFESEYRFLSSGGSVRWVLARGRAHYDEDGEVTRFPGVTVDITERMAAEQRLRVSEAGFQGIVNSIDQMIWSTRPDGYHDYYNDRWYEYTGVPKGSTDGEEWNGMFHPEDQDRAWNVWRHSLATGEPYHIEYRLRHRSGDYRWVLGRAQPVRGEEGQITRWFGTCTDIQEIVEAREVLARSREDLDRLVVERTAELEQTQEALRQSQKMEAVGQLTGGIAHDFNNMLAVVIGSLDLLGRRIGVHDPRARRYVDAAADGARRAALLTQRLLAFSRQQPLRPESIDANKLVAGMSDLLRRSLGSDVHLETVLAGELWRTHADPNQLENVILNLAVNARDAMPEGGRLTIETQNTHLDTRYVAAELGVSAGQYVLIAVTDTGFGMPAEVIAKAFEPFYTTKEVGKGTGLGLSQVYGFVKQSGGHVKIDSEPGHGATVTIYLPRLVGVIGEATEDAGAPELPLGEPQEVVLVVEDEPAVRQFSVDALGELGYRVLEADGAAAALRLLDAHPEIALLFTDIVMPDVNGARLSDEARRRWPDLKVLFTTGYTRNAVVHDGVRDPSVALIGKPFTIDELAAKVREVLDARLSRVG